MELLLLVAIVRHEAVIFVLGVFHAQGIPIDQVINGFILDQEVRATDGVGFRIVLLTKQLDMSIRVQPFMGTVATNIEGLKTS